MKTSTAVIVGVLALGLVGGGAAYALSQQPAEEPTAQVESTGSPSPEPTEVPAPEPTVTATPTPEPTVEPTPAVTPTVAPYTELEQQFIEQVGGMIRESGYVGTDADIIALAHAACASVDAGEKPLETRIVPDVSMNVNAGFINAAATTWDIC